VFKFLVGRIQLKKLFISIVTVFVVLTTLLTRPALAGDAAVGKQLFGANCASCHAGGKNAVNPAKTLSSADLTANGKNSEEAIMNQIKKGAGAMPAFAGRLNDTQIADIASYVFAQAAADWK
jgi:cytochrome c6